MTMLRFLPLLSAFLLVAIPAAASAQSTPWRVVQASDGSLYLLKDGARSLILPALITDEDLSAIPELDPISGELPQPSAPTALLPPAQDPVTITGQREMNTDLFTLSGGNYVVTWTAKPIGTSNSCFHGASLKPLKAGNGFYGESVGSGQVSGANPVAGETHVYAVPSGQYFISATSGCQWSLTLKGMP